MKCLICSKVFFNKKHKEQKICSRKCWGLSIRTIKKHICFFCKKEFRPKTNIKSNKYCSQECYWKWMKDNTKGENCVNWKGGIRGIDYIERRRFQREIQKQVFKRDNYTCQICGQHNGKLQVDHIQSWAKYVDLRFNIENCRTLCQKCHYFITFNKPMPKNVKKWGHNFSNKQNML